MRVYRCAVLFRMLGPVEIEARDRVWTLPRRRERCLLGVLLLDLDAVVPVDRLAELLWDGDPPERARRIIHGHISRVRTLLGESGAAPAYELATVGSGYRLTGDPDAVDAHRFRALVAAAAALADPAARVERLHRALALWRGQVLDQAASHWLRQRLCTELEERRLAAVEDLMADSLALGRERGVLPELARMASAHPGRERLVELYMRALHRVGRKAEALEAYARARRYLADELGIDPGPALRERQRAILRDEPAAEPPSPSEAVAPALSGAGASRARSAVGHREATDLAPVVPRQLPAAVGQFVGRTRELAVLDRAHDASTAVISAIDGMAGIGKTALAVHLAHRIAGRYPDGQLFIDLHGYTRGVAPVGPADALDRMLRSLGIAGTQVPADVDERAALYRSRLADRRMLIVLDNAATEAQVRPLLPGAPGCLVLVTSRRRLAGLDHTHALSLDTLPVPDAVRLLTRTAGAGRLADEPPEPLAELVELCGRLPLAIRIAAARLRSRPSWRLSHLVERLRDQRHRLDELAAGERSVIAALDLSYDDLDPDQRRAYRLLGLHPGPDLDAYATAALLDATLRDAGRMLDRLLDAHLLQEPTPGRYRFHDLTRAHAARIATGDEQEPTRTAALDRLLDYYRHAASLATDAAYPHEREHLPRVPSTGGPVPDLSAETPALSWLDTELPNLLAAARYAAEHDRPAHVGHLSAILQRHIHTRGRYQEAESLHRQALAAARTTGDRTGELTALNGLGEVCRPRGRYEQAIDHHRRALEIARAIGHRAGELMALVGLAQDYQFHGRAELAIDHYRQALDLARATGHGVGELKALTGLAWIPLRQGHYELTAEYLTAALQLARGIGDRVGELNALTGLGHVHRFQGRYDLAAEHYSRGLRLARTTGNHIGKQAVLTALGHVRRFQGEYEQAVGLYEEGLRLAYATGHRIGELDALGGIGSVCLRQGRYERAGDAYRRLLAGAENIDDRNWQFEAWHGLGRLKHATGRLQEAITHHGRALALAEELDQQVDQVRAHDALARAHSARHRYEQAGEHWRRALAILTRLGVDHTGYDDATTAAIRANLAELDRLQGTTAPTP